MRALIVAELIASRASVVHTAYTRHQVRAVLSEERLRAVQACDARETLHAGAHAVCRFHRLTATW